MTGQMASLGGSVAGRIDAILADDGKIHVFFVSAQRRILHIYQTGANPAWSNWEEVAVDVGALTPVKLFKHPIGMLNLFYIDGVGFPTSLRQRLDGTWDAPVPILDGPPLISIAGVGRDDQGFHLFGMSLVGSTTPHVGALYIADQDPVRPGAVGNWIPLPGSYATDDPLVPFAQGYLIDVVAPTNRDGRLEVLTLTGTRSLANISKNNLAQINPPQDLGGWAVSSPVAAKDSEGHIQLVVCGAEGVVYHRYQQQPESLTGNSIKTTAWSRFAAQ